MKRFVYKDARHTYKKIGCVVGIIEVVILIGIIIGVVMEAICQ